MASTASDKPLTGGFQGEATEEELQQPLVVVSELVQGSPVTSIAGDEALTELEAKYAELQEQLHYTKEENSLLNQNLEEKEQNLTVLKDIMDQDKALLEEVSCENKILKECLEEKKQELGILNNVITQDKGLLEEVYYKNNVLQQQQQDANEEIERLKKEIQVGKNRIKELWRTNCEQLAEFDQTLLEKEEELQSLRDMLQNRRISDLSLSEPAKSESLISQLVWPTGISSTTQPLCPVTSVSETLPTMSELSTNYLPVVSTTMSRMSHGVASTHSEPAVWSSGGTSRPPPQGPPGIGVPVSQPFLVTAAVRSTTSQAPGPMSLPTSVVSSFPPLLSRAPAVSTPLVQRRGKAPLVDPFTADDPEITFDDWLPTLERAAVWNGWSEEETLMQLAGYLRNRALQEWNLLSQGDCNTLKAAVKTLSAKLDPGNQTLSALDFHHAMQKDSEAVADYIRRLECTFQIGFGRGKMSIETRNALLYGQLQSGLAFELSKSPAVSGARNYEELCIAAKNEESRLAELEKRQQYERSRQIASARYSTSSSVLGSSRSIDAKQTGQSYKQSPRCYICNSPTHLARDCKTQRSESEGRTRISKKTNILRSGSQSEGSSPGESHFQEVAENLFPFISATTSTLTQATHQTDDDSPQSATVNIEGVPVTGIIDMGSDITIISGDMFKTVIAKAGLKKEEFKTVDKQAFTYNKQSITLDGRMDTNISFEDKQVYTTIYVKMEAPSPLLLFEAVCRQLGIIQYHPNVKPLDMEKKAETAKQAQKNKVRLIQTI